MPIIDAFDPHSPKRSTSSVNPNEPSSNMSSRVIIKVLAFAGILMGFVLLSYLLYRISLSLRFKLVYIAKPSHDNGKSNSTGDESKPPSREIASIGPFRLSKPPLTKPTAEKRRSLFKRRSALILPSCSQRFPFPNTRLSRLFYCLDSTTTGLHRAADEIVGAHPASCPLKNRESLPTFDPRKCRLVTVRDRVGYILRLHPGISSIGSNKREQPRVSFGPGSLSGSTGHLHHSPTEQGPIKSIRRSRSQPTFSTSKSSTLSGKTISNGSRIATSQTSGSNLLHLFPSPPRSPLAMNKGTEIRTASSVDKPSFLASDPEFLSTFNKSSSSSSRIPRLCQAPVSSPRSKDKDIVCSVVGRQPRKPVYSIDKSTSFSILPYREGLEMRVWSGSCGSLHTKSKSGQENVYRPGGSTPRHKRGKENRAYDVPKTRPAHSSGMKPKHVRGKSGTNLGILSSTDKRGAKNEAAGLHSTSTKTLVGVAF